MHYRHPCFSMNEPLFLLEWENFLFPLRMHEIYMKSAYRYVIFAVSASYGLTGIQKSPVSCFFVQLRQPISFSRVGWVPARDLQRKEKDIISIIPALTAEEYNTCLSYDPFSDSTNSVHFYHGPDSSYHTVSRSNKSFLYIHLPGQFIRDL